VLIHVPEIIEIKQRLGSVEPVHVTKVKKPSATTSKNIGAMTPAESPKAGHSLKPSVDLKHASVNDGMLRVGEDMERSKEVLKGDESKSSEENMSKADEKNRSQRRSGSETPKTKVSSLSEKQSSGILTICVPEVLKSLFEQHKIKEACFVKDDDDIEGHHYLVTIPLLKDRAEKLRIDLINYGVGVYYGTLSILPMEIHRTAKEVLGEDMLKNVRPEVEKVVRMTADSSKLNFDFCALCVVASILAASGLATNNTVIIVASMLVSPLMGPIMSATFGFIVADTQMFNEAIKTEMYAIFLCWVSGFFVGIGFAQWGEDLDWPTVEMESRGVPSALLVGIVIAIPSGVGVALSSLSNNTASLVGVAISAALLPPAVNVGICFAYAFFQQWGLDREFDSTSSEFMIIGAISFALYILNIVFIFLAAIATFKYKEIYTPDGGKNVNFWQNLGELRKQNRGDHEETDEHYKELKKITGLNENVLQGLKRTEGIDEQTVRRLLGGQAKDLALPAAEEKKGKQDPLNGKLRNLFLAPDKTVDFKSYHERKSLANKANFVLKGPAKSYHKKDNVKALVLRPPRLRN